MKALPIIPYPNHVEFLGGEVAITPEFPIISKNNDTIGSKEGYELKITQSGIEITAKSQAGHFYAEQTLKQLKRMNKTPCVVIKDEPAYEYRGFMLDSVRHMTAFDEVKKLIDAMALFKLNVFHWHLTDDQGWRIETDKWQNLTKIGSIRSASQFGDINDMTEHGGYYTKNQLREIVEYCAQRHITVVPEFDLPGHTRSVLASYPELSCTGEKLNVPTRQGIYKDVLCLGNEKTFELVFDVLDGIIEIFPSKIVHIGGDEVPKSRWSKCPKCQSKMKQLGLKNEEELQGWFVQKVIDFLSLRGASAILWNESLNSGKIKDKPIAQNWMDKKGVCVEYANNGGKLIISDFYHYYLDYPYAMTPLKKTFNYNPLIKGLTNEGKKNILGVEAPIWTEHVRDFEKMGFMCYPRAAAVAQTGWTNPESKDLNTFYESFDSITPLLNEIGITPAPKKEWDPHIFKRIIGTAKFFKGFVDFGSILNAIRNDK